MQTSITAICGSLVKHNYGPFHGCCWDAFFNSLTCDRGPNDWCHSGAGMDCHTQNCICSRDGSADPTSGLHLVEQIQQLTHTIETLKPQDSLQLTQSVEMIHQPHQTQNEAEDQTQTPDQEHQICKMLSLLVLFFLFVCLGLISTTLLTANTVS